MCMASPAACTFMGKFLQNISVALRRYCFFNVFFIPNTKCLLLRLRRAHSLVNCYIIFKLQSVDNLYSILFFSNIKIS